MLEEKKYKVKIVGSFSGESQEKKTPYFGLELETPCEEVVEWVVYLKSDSPEAKERAKKSLKLLAEAGFKGKKLSDLSNDKLSMEDLFDEVSGLTVTMKHEEYTDKEGEIKTKAVVQWFNTSSFGVAKADHKQSVKIFQGTVFDGMLKEMKGTIKPKTVKEKESTESESEEFSEDDIPF